MVGNISTGVRIPLRLRRDRQVLHLLRKVGIRLPEKGNSNSHGARPVYYNHHDDEVDPDQ